MNTASRTPILPDNRLGREIGVIGPYAETPAYQIAHDAHGKIRHIAGLLVTEEYGPNGDLFKTHPAWADINAKAIELERRFAARSNDGFYAHLLIQEADALRDGPLKAMVDAVNAQAARATEKADG